MDNPESIDLGVPSPTTPAAAPSTPLARRLWAFAGIAVACAFTFLAGYAAHTPPPAPPPAPAAPATTPADHTATLTINGEQPGIDVTVAPGHLYVFVTGAEHPSCAITIDGHQFPGRADTGPQALVGCDAIVP